ncbi:GNAT family N-acetyltransferase [Aliikangiella maris]|uniref:GNAT family N-acetyltransferase n=2 Tax=Aliikangiella maris TaxID=3162458 RepID=A0ABV2BXV5_9GAMM
MDYSKSLQLKIITDRKKFAEVKAFWLNFKQETQIKFYNDFYFYRAYFKHLKHPDITPFLVLIYEGENLIGILPWEKRSVGLGVYQIGTLSHPHVDLNDALFVDNKSTLILQAITMLKSQTPAICLFSLPKLRQDSSLSQLLINQNAIDTFHWQTSESKFIEFQQTPLIEILPKRHLKNVNRLIRKAENIGDVKYSFIKGEDITPEQIKEFLDLEASGWKGKQGSCSAISLNKDLIGFYHSLFNNSKKNIQLNCYHLDGQLLAAHFCFINGGTISLAKVCYRQEFSNLSPGHVLIYKAMENAQLEGKVTKISFVTGPGWLAPWKPSTKVVETYTFALNPMSKLYFNGAKFFRSAINWYHKIKSPTTPAAPH